MAGPTTSARPLFEPAIVRRALVDSLRKLDPRNMIHNPVMFVVEVGSVLTTFIFFRDLGKHGSSNDVFTGLVTVFLWFTVLFANFAEAIAEGRGKAQAETLRKTRSETVARKRLPDGTIEECASTLLTIGDECVVTAGEVIPGDGDVVEGIASVDESAITGESAPVIRESGGDRSAVTGGTRVLSDEIVVRISAKPGETFLDRMIALLVEGADRQKTPNEIALSILLSGLTIIFLLAVVTLQPFAVYSGAPQTLVILTALLVCLIPTTIGGLLSAIGIAGMDRLVQHNVLAMSGRAVEAAGDVSTLLLDKTGTITIGNREAVQFLPVGDVTEHELAEAALLSSLADETPEGRSIVKLATDDFGLEQHGDPSAPPSSPFTAQTRMSGVDIPANGVAARSVRKGVSDSVKVWVGEQGGLVSPELTTIVDGISTRAAPRSWSRSSSATAARRPPRALGVIYLKDIVKSGMRERFDELRAMGIRTVMITGDNPRTAAFIANEAGVDDFLAEATPEDKMALIKHEQSGGHLVAMTGDGTNDAPGPRPGGRRCRHEHRYASGEGGRQHGRPRLRPDEAHRHRRDRQAAPDHSRFVDHVLHCQRRGDPLVLCDRFLVGGLHRIGGADKHLEIAERCLRPEELALVGFALRRKAHCAGHGGQARVVAPIAGEMAI